MGQGQGQGHEQRQQQKEAWAGAGFVGRTGSERGRGRPRKRAAGGPWGQGRAGSVAFEAECGSGLMGRGVVCAEWWVVSGWMVGLWCCAGAGEDLQHCRTAVLSRRKMEISVHRLQHVLTVVAT